MRRPTRGCEIARCQCMRSGRAAAITDTRRAFLAGSGSGTRNMTPSLFKASGNTAASASGARCAELATPYFVFPHGMLDPWFKRTYPLKHLKKLLYWPWAEYRVLRDAAAVLFTSEEERRLARESFWPYRCNEVVVNYGTAAPEIDLASAREDFFGSFPQLRGQAVPAFPRSSARKERLRTADRGVRGDAQFLARRSIARILSWPVRALTNAYQEHLKRAGLGAHPASRSPACWPAT